VQAEVGKVYDFKDVMITVRESEEASTHWLTFLFMFVGITSLLLFIGLYIGGK